MTMGEAAETGVTLGRHAFGRFDRRLPIGPVEWPFHDLLWLHEGEAWLRFAHDGATLHLKAPDGVLILPGTRFQGAASGAYATASVCHFTLARSGPTPLSGPGYRRPHRDEAFAIHSQIRLALQLSRKRPETTSRRVRLLLAILDGFADPDEPAWQSGEPDRLSAAWEMAALHLETIRSLADVAALMGVSESALRAAHRKVWRKPAGEHLRDLRLSRAEELLATTGDSMAEIAARVGYAHAETFQAAFRNSRGVTPGAWRRRAKPFA